MEELPEHIKTQMERVPERQRRNIEAFYDPQTGKVHLIAERITPSRAAKVAFHEVAVHKGLRDAMGDHFDLFIEKVQQDFADEIEDFRNSDAGQQYSFADDSELAEEWLAHLGETLVDAKDRSLLGRLADALRRFLRKIPKFARLRYTQGELEGMILAAARNARNGRRRFNTTSVLEQNGRFSIIGEEGAANLDRYFALNYLDNLSTAKKMLDAGQDAETIKFATGWEKGGDGKWRMEVPDLKFTTNAVLPDGTEFQRTLRDVVYNTDGKLGEYAEAPELFAAYPQLKDIGFSITDLEDSLIAAHYIPSSNKIEINRYHVSRIAERINYEEISEYPDQERINTLTEKLFDFINENMIHETQHAIQEIEGFARGSNFEYFADKSIKNPEYVKAAEDAAAKEYEIRKKLEEYPQLYFLAERLLYLDDHMSDDDLDIDAMLQENEDIEQQFRDMGMEQLLDDFWNAVTATRQAQRKADKYLLSPIDAQHRTAGEVEARNATKRSEMSMEERRESLLDETADVAPEDRIYLFKQLWGIQIAENNNLFKYFTGSIEDFLLKIKKSDNHLIKKIISPVSQRMANYLSINGINVDSSYNHVVDNYSIIHVMNGHSNIAKEQARGQIPITYKDIKMIDKVINEFDNIVVDNGKIVYAKKLPDGTVLYIEEVRRGRKELAFVSMRKMKGNIPNDLMEKMLSPENLNAWNDSAILPSDGNIPQNPENASDMDNDLRFSMRADETWKEMADKLATRIMPVIRDHTATISLAEEIKTLLLEEGFLLEDAEVNEIIAKAKDMLRGWQARMRARQDLAYIYETDPWLNAIAAVYGDNFRIVPGEKYRGEEFDGTWINNKKKWHLQGESNPC